MAAGLKTRGGKGGRRGGGERVAVSFAAVDSGALRLNPGREKMAAASLTDVGVGVWA